MSDKKTSKDAERDLLAPVSFDEFKKPTYEQWQAEVEKALKGGDFHKKMFTKTYEGITLQPIYTPALHGEKIPKGVYPGAGEFLRGTKASGYIKDSWGVSQYVDESFPKDANHASLYEIVKGGTIHNIRLDEATRHDQDVQVGAAVGIGGTSPGFANWTVGEAPFVGGWESILAIFMVAGFSFQGTELIGVAAGEAEDPEKNVPKAINTIFWRILLFYIGAFTVIGFLIPYTDPNLLNSSVENVSISPFTLVFDRFGFAFAASFINAIILTAVLSAGNSGLYSSTRMLYALAKEGQAPQIFAKLNKRGVPVPALILTTAIGLFAFLTSFIGEGTAYTWIVNISGLCGFIAWVGIAVSHYRFRRAFIAQGRDLSELPSTGTAYPLPTLAYQSSSQFTLVTNTSTKLKLCR